MNIAVAILSIILFGLLNNAEIKVFDVLGKQVLTLPIFIFRKLSYSENDLESGLYFYQFLNNNRVERAGKLVIE